MGAGWIAQGADTPAPAADVDPWKPIGPDASSVPSLVRPHQDPDAHAVDNTRGLFTRGKDLLFGHEPTPGDSDQVHQAGILPAVGTAAKNLWDQGSAENVSRGPALSTLATAYPHLVGAEFGKVKAGYQEQVGAAQVQAAERTLAALNVLPQVAARTKPGDLDPVVAMSKDPLVDKTARKLGVSPQEFAGDWGKYSGFSAEEQADMAARAQQTLQKGHASLSAGKDTRLNAWADERAWQPADLANGKLDPWSAKGIAFNAALAIPELAAVTGAAVAGGAVGGPGGAAAAGGATAAALFAPAQRSDAKNKIDDQVSRLLQKADALDDAAPVGGRRGLNPVTEQIRQQAADLEANSDKIANTAGFLYAVGDAAGALPVSAILSRSPAGKAVLDRIVGAAVGKTVGGRIAGTMVANGAGGALQAAVQKGVDAGIVHENTTLSDALKDIAYAGVTAAVTAAPIAGIHEFAGAPGRAREAAAETLRQRNLDSDDVLAKVRQASDAMAGTGPSAVPGEEYPGYKWNPNAPNPGAPGGKGKYEPTTTAGPGGGNRSARLTGPAEATAAGDAAGPAPAGPAGASGKRQAYQSKIDALNAAAASAEKRSDVTLEPEEEGWSVHVNGEPKATFETVEAARQAMAQARKVVGTRPAETGTEAPSGETEGAPRATKPPPRETKGQNGETALERTQPIQPERRSQGTLRERFDQMTGDQRFAALYAHDVTGIPNKRAYDDSPKKATQVSVDADSLKWFNAQGSHEGGDQLLKAIAQAGHEQSPGNFYHKGGDEFVLQADSPAEAEAHMAAIHQRLAGATIEMTAPDGRRLVVNGIGVTHGTGSTFEAADRAMEAEKGRRTAAGLRAGREQQPPGATFAAAEAGLPSDQGHAAAEVLGQKVEAPDVPTPAQAKAGNYFKPEVNWHGIPVKVENTKGSMRPFVDAVTGKPGRRKMKADYGYIPGTTGADADGVDIMMGPHPEVKKAWVIDQLKPNGEFDEHKIQVGVRSEAEAREQYLSHYPAGWKGLGAITELSAEQLNRWRREGDLRQPLSADAVPPAKVERGSAADPRVDSILQWLARHPRGLDRAEAQSQGIDPADMGLAAAHVGIRRAFRKNGLSFDHAAEALHEAGYPVADAQGRYSPNVLLDRIDDELRGRKHYSAANASHAPESRYAKDWRQPLSDAELDKLSVEGTRERIGALQAEQERLERELDRAEDDDVERIPFMRGKGPGVQQDLFGAVVNVKNEIKRLETALDAKRNTGQESVETGRPDDLFSQARQQVDIEDKPAAAKTGALEDAGEKIGGARKDKWAERGMRLADLSTMTEGEAATLVNKKAVWNPQWGEMVVDGMPVDVAALGKVIFDQLAAKPRLNTPDGRRHYVETLGRVRDMIVDAKDQIAIRAIEGRLVAELGMPTGYSIASTPEQRLARDKFWAIQKGRRSTLRVAGSDVRKAEALVAAGWPAKKLKEAAAPAGDGDKEKGPPEPKRPHLDEINRVGPPVRAGDITSTNFIRDMGFRGLEFGNWAASDERQRLLNHAYEALHDLARIMNVPPKALSLNGTMGLALGARGGGRFAAHYESGKLVINMTKINGAGALAHEWAHALDHYMGELGRPDAYTTAARGATGWHSDRRSLGHLRPEMQAAWNGVMEAIFKRNVGAAEHIRDNELAVERLTSDRQKVLDGIAERPADTNLPVRLTYVDRGIANARAAIAAARANPEGVFGTRPTDYIRQSQRLGEYWRRPNEMFARAFEGYVQDKIAAEGNQSDYLVQGAEGERFADAKRFKGNPYPLDDRPAINAAIQKLVDALQTRTEGGKEVLFRRGTSPGGGMEVGAVRAVVHRFLQGFKVKPQVIVVDTLHDLDDHAEVGHIARREANQDAVAFVHPRTQKIYLIADQLHSPEHVASAFAHEYITHFGLRAMFGDSESSARYQAILDGVAAAMPAELRARGAQAFPRGFNALNREQRHTAAEEVLAYYGQEYARGQSIPERLRRWFDKLRAMLRDWLRKKVGALPKFDELFVKRTLADLETFLRSSHRPAQGTSGEAPAFAARQDTFFSGLAKAVDAAKREKGTGAEWEATLRNMPGVKAEELHWTGLKDWLDGRGRVSKADVAEFVHANRVHLGEVLRGGNTQQPLTDEHLATINQRLEDEGYDALYDDQRAALRAGGDDAHGMLDDLNARIGISLADIPYSGDALQPKFGQYASPGGQNYRELLMTLAPRGPAAQVLAGRKAVFDRYAGRITELSDRAMDITNSDEPNWERNRQAAASEANRLRDERDAEANAVGWIDPQERRVAAQDAKGRANADYQNAVNRLADAWGPSQLEYSNMVHWLLEASNPESELQASSMAKLERMVVPSGAFPDGGRQELDTALAKAAVLNDAHREVVAAGKVQGATQFRGSHWDEPNVLAHVRFDDRTGPAGEHVLHVHEIQSDWHQKGRKQGYLIANPTQEDAKRLFGITDAVWAKLPEEQREAYRLEAGSGERHVTQNTVPDAPFKTTWPDLAAKRMIRYAAERGYDAITWDTGETNAERYSLEKQISALHVGKEADGTYSLGADTRDGPADIGSGIRAEDLERYVGKEMAQRIVDDKDIPTAPGRGKTYSGLDLKVGGQGMKAFYDKMLPATVGKLVKRWGGKVEPGAVTGAVAHNGTRSVVDEHGGVSFTGEHEQIPVHMVKITPAMRDSVMGGQPMFLKRRKGSSGDDQRPFKEPDKGAYERVRKLVQAVPASELNLSFRRIVDPAGVSEAAKATAIVTREALGELAQSSEEALRNLEQYAKAFDALPVADRYEFIHAMETGEPQANKDLQPAADAIRKLLDGWRENIRGLGVGALDNFIENYFPHIWQRDDRARKIFGQIFGRRPLKGPASFLKERTIPTTREGLAAGLKPISTNPLILAFAKLREMMRFYTGVKLMQRFKDEGLAKFLPSGKLMPDGWGEIDDAVGRVRQWSEAEQGFVERGRYIMPVDGARVINNHLSGSALRNFLPALVFRSVSNMANALQLGFSAFHLGFTTLDAVVSKNALAVEQLLHGEPLRASRSLLEAFAAGAPANLLRGRALMRAYVDPKTASPELRRIVEGLTAAGGRVKMDNYFQASQGLSPFREPGAKTAGAAIGAAVGGITGGLPGAFLGGAVGSAMGTLAADVRMALQQPHNRVVAVTKTLASFPQQHAMKLWTDLRDMAHTLAWPWLSVALEIVGRATRASTSIIMEHIVPLQKLGVFSDLAADHIRRNPFEDQVAFAAAMQSIWNSVDNRLGEMVYDNVFWNRTFKDVNHMMVRAVGWNLGTIRELGGAPVDAVKLLDYILRGAPAEGGQSPLGKGAQARQGYEEAKSKLQRIAEKAGHKIPYTLALIGTTMLLGAVLTKAFTGDAPKEIKDYFFPPTGRKTKYGTPERISMPSYTKDLFEYGTQPVNTLINKANPLFGIVHAIYANEDFFGNPVYNPDHTFEQQTWEKMLYGAREVAPFSIQGTKQFQGAGDMDAKGKTLAVMPYVGFGPAPARVTSPEQMERYQLRETEKKWVRGLQRQLRGAVERGDKAEVDRLRQDIRESKLKERATEHDIRDDKVKARETAAKISNLVDGKTRSEAAAAAHAAGLPAFAALLRSLPDRPRDRVAGALEAFA